MGLISLKALLRKHFAKTLLINYCLIHHYLLSDINAAVLWAQLESCDRITQRRLEIWHQYHRAFTDLETQNKLRRPIVPQHCQHNAHMYYLLLPNVAVRTAFIEALKQQGINTVFHYVPLHSSPAGKKYGRSAVLQIVPVDPTLEPAPHPTA